MPNRLTQIKHARDCDCEACLTEYGDHFEAVLLADRLAATDPERNGAVPATEEEWREYLDREFPRVKTFNGHILRVPGDGHECPKYMSCPTCDWGLSICQKCWRAEAELDQPCDATQDRRPGLDGRNEP